MTSFKSIFSQKMRKAQNAAATFDPTSRLVNPDKAAPFHRPDEVLFHIGAPKTATTTLQSMLVTNAHLFERQGVEVYTPRDVRGRPSFLPFQRFYREDVEVPNGEAFLTMFADKRPSRALVSEEAMTNDLMPSRYVATGGFARMARTIEFIKALDIPRTRIVLTIRRQDHYLKSVYGHMVEHKNARAGFEGWLINQVDLTDMSWLKVVDALDEAFGPENVEVVPFEIIKDAGNLAFYTRCLRSLGLDMSDHEEGAEVWANSALSEPALRIARIMNEFKTTNRALIEERRKLINATNAFLRGQGAQSLVVELSPVTEKTQALYAEENAALAARKFPDLKSIFDFHDV